MDDSIRRLVQQQELYRAMTEGPLRYIRDTEAALARMQQFAQGVDATALQHFVLPDEANDMAKRLQAISAPTDTALAKFTEASVVAEMERCADRHRRDSS